MPTLSRALLVAAALTAIGCGDSSPANSPADASPDVASQSDASAPLPDAAIDIADASPPPSLSCATYCSAVLSSCTGAHAQYVAASDCSRFCVDLPPGTFGDDSDSLGCRQAHANAAAKDPTANCAAAGPFGGGTCGGRCDDFCALLFARCPGTYGHQAECWNDCDQHYPYDPKAGDFPETGNTLNCRATFLNRIEPDAGDMSSLCASAGPQSAECK